MPAVTAGVIHGGRRPCPWFPGTRHIAAVLCQQLLPGLRVCEGSSTLRHQPLFYNSYNLDLVQFSVVNKLSHVWGEWRAFSEDLSFALYLKIKILLRKLRGHTKLCRLLHEYFPVTSSMTTHFGRCSFFRLFELGFALNVLSALERLCFSL